MVMRQRNSFFVARSDLFGAPFLQSPKSLPASLCGSLSQEMRHMKFWDKGVQVVLFVPNSGNTKKEDILESHYVLAMQIKLFPKLDLQDLQMAI